MNNLLFNLLNDLDLDHNPPKYLPGYNNNNNNNNKIHLYSAKIQTSNGALQY